jgi:hypothetical protein
VRISGLRFPDLILGLNLDTNCGSPTTIPGSYPESDQDSDHDPYGLIPSPTVASDANLAGLASAGQEQPASGCAGR